MRRLPLGVALVILLAAPATAGAVPDLRVTEHVVPATASTGEVVKAGLGIGPWRSLLAPRAAELGLVARNDNGG